MAEADDLVLEAQVAMCGLTMREYRALPPEAQARVRKTRLENDNNEGANDAR